MLNSYDCILRNSVGSGSYDVDGSSGCSSNSSSCRLAVVVVMMIMVEMVLIVVVVVVFMQLRDGNRLPVGSKWYLLS